MILRDPARLGPAGQARLAALRGRCPDLDALAGHITAFAKILTSRRGGSHLDAWLDAVEADPPSPTCTPSPPASARTTRP
jgi:hypothetical protein